MDSKVEYRFLLSFKRQSNLHFWPLFCFEWKLGARSPTKAARNFQPITGSLLKTQSKETENRDTMLYHDFKTLIITITCQISIANVKCSKIKPLTDKEGPQVVFPTKNDV